ncbi:hypothetical protein A2837_03265 [Candidatus Kaiserbacteria bacterium RIFCSPHIGHO2_01_FULL_46_22]|uniref:Uncharacterized protein n=1 Tax=Candidatus Kaiserbacteria bacterium RIFCSPHIGHO2_01_FULL_46_22 TaxID=1798475 RepID=A0A1F6BYA8_9BACT|nr:MAG: hypothetical protein A2837_03265 [Candidatus Kaiserbacteria bacterium RIFCSPHIGHO2_01_FULL_46_22]
MGFVVGDKGKGLWLDKKILCRIVRARRSFTRENEMSANTESEDDIKLQYLCFCENPLRSTDQILRDYEVLKAHPRVTGIAFHSPYVLMIGTDEIVVTENHKKRLIGEFIIFLIRKKVESYWEIDFRFWNVTNTLTVSVEGNESVYVHPHIYVTDDDFIGCPSGQLCINHGQFDVYQYIRRGEMHYAAPRLIEILETYPTGTAFHGADNWPLWRKKDA